MLLLEESELSSGLGWKAGSGVQQVMQEMAFASDGSVRQEVSPSFTKESDNMI